jgi:hypothetical protein
VLASAWTNRPPKPVEHLMLGRVDGVTGENMHRRGPCVVALVNGDAVVVSGCGVGAAEYRRANALHGLTQSAES